MKKSVTKGTADQFLARLRSRIDKLMGVEASVDIGDMWEIAELYERLERDEDKLEGSIDVNPGITSFDDMLDEDEVDEIKDRGVVEAAEDPEYDIKMDSFLMDLDSEIIGRDSEGIIDYTEYDYDDNSIYMTIAIDLSDKGGEFTILDFEVPLSDLKLDFEDTSDDIDYIADQVDADLEEYM